MVFERSALLLVATDVGECVASSDAEFATEEISSDIEMAAMLTVSTHIHLRYLVIRMFLV